MASAKRIGAHRIFVGGGAPFPELSMADKKKLAERFRPEVDRLEAMLNRDLSAWK